MKIVAKEGTQLFATLTEAEFETLDRYRNRFAAEPEHTRGVKVGAVIDLAAWVVAAEHVTGAREGLETLRDLFTRQVEALAGPLTFASSDEFDAVTLADWLKAIKALGDLCARFVKLRQHFEREVAEVERMLDDIGPPELKT